MFRNHFAGLFLTAIAAMIALGCGGNPGPAEPGVDLTPAAQAETPANNHQCLGYYLLAVDTENRSVDLLPLRTADLHLNMVTVLNTTLGVQAVSVPSDADPPNGIFAFDITLVHPFGTKTQLAGFDVKGILITPGTYSIATLKIAGPDETKLLNTDGYTRWWNPSEFTEPGLLGYVKGKLANAPGSALTANINPYKHFADILQAIDDLSVLETVGLDDGQGRGVFTAGSSNTRRYRIKFPMNPGPQIVYGYAIDACWMAPSPNPPTEIPDNFPISANQPEAYHFDLDLPVNTLFYDSESGVGGGVLVMDAAVHDWQGTDSGDIYGQIGVVRSYSPGLFSSTYDLAAMPDPPAGEADFRSTAEGIVPTHTGDYEVAVRVESKGGPTYVQGAAPAPAENVSAWQVAQVEVVDPECETDSNNSLPEAELLTGIGTQHIDATLCGGTDDADYYRIDIPLGKKFGGVIDFYSGLPDTTLGVAKSDWAEIYSSPIDGHVQFTGSGLDMLSGTYYFKISTTSSGIAGLYTIVSNYHQLNFQLNYQGEVTPPWLSLDATWIKAYGNYLFLANRDYLWVYDVTVASEPVFVNRLQFQKQMTGITFRYPSLYYFANDGETTYIYWIDVTNPSALIDQYVLSINPAIDMIFMDSSYVYMLSDGSGNDDFVSANQYSSDSGSLDYVTSFDVADGNPIQMDMLFEGGPHPTLILTYSDAGIYAYNVYDLSSVYLLDFLPNIMSVTTEMTTIYPSSIARINCSTISGNYELDLYEFTGGSTFTFKDYVDLSSSPVPASMISYGNYVVVCSDNNSLDVFDISNPTNITYAYGYTNRSKVTCMSYTSDHLWMMQEYYDPIYAIITGGQLLQYEYEPNYGVDYPRNAFTVGDYMYLGCGNGDEGANFAIIDITDPPAAYNIYKWDMGYVLGSFCGNNKIAAWSRVGDQFWWLHPNGSYISDSGSENLPQDISGIAVSNEAMYVALKSPPLMKVYSIVDYPGTAPVAQPDVSISYELKNMLVNGNALYGFTGDTMVVYDVTSPMAPVQHTTWGPVMNMIMDRIVIGNSLFLLLSDSIVVFDVTDPLNPSYLTTTASPYLGMTSLAAIQNYLLVSDQIHHPVFIDISDPSTPVVYGEPITTDKFYPIRNIIAQDEYLYELADSIGVRIFKMY